MRSAEPDSHHVGAAPESREALRLAMLLWSGSIVLGAVSVTLNQAVTTGAGPQLSDAWKYVWMASTLVLAIPLSLGLFRLVILLAGLRTFPRVLVVAPFVLIAAVLQAVFDHEIGAVLGRLAGAAPFRPLFSPALILNVNSYLGLYALYVCLIELVTMRARAQRSALREAEARDLARKAQLDLLWFQLNPHFLFNTLNNIISLVVTAKPARATAMLRRLSTYLRATLDLHGSAMLSLEREMEAVEAYIEIEAVRFDGALALDIDYPAALRQATVPALILLPIVENAVKYAAAPSGGDSRIAITAGRTATGLWIEVLDTGRAPGVAAIESGTGLGLRNVRERLSAQYGDAARLEAGPSGPGFRVRLETPLQGRGD
ncbi:sensor histidine kinase [Brevundimonas sp. NPDC092305]|uniref:sensor histidine kinase n=1 Tax=Brevundimonas sp. NPDC092305 TaxID=3363957 RepID=UPI003806E880